MPSLPMPEAPVEGRGERMATAFHRASAAIGADARVTLRTIVFLIVAVVSVSFAETPWTQIGTVALLGLALDWARTKSRNAPPT